MANVTKYEVLMYGGGSGYQGYRAQISLSDGSTHIGYIRFVDAGTTVPTDGMSGNAIVMYQSISMFQNVVDLLRKENSRVFYLAGTHAFLGAEGN